MQPFVQDSPRVLVADDQHNVLDAIRLLLKGEGYQAEAVTGPSGVLNALQSENFDVVLMDLNYTKDTTSGGEGLDLLSHIRLIDQSVPLVVMTAWGNMELAIEAMRRGACDFVLKPWQNRQLIETLREQIERHQKQRRISRDQARELAEAQEIQSKLLPQILPTIPGFEIAAGTQAVRGVGGDYFDVVKLASNKTALCIADVAGKGLPAALLMSSLQAAMRPVMLSGAAPADVARQMNATIAEIAPAGKFISMVYCLLDEKTRTLTYVNAGHNLPVLVRGGGSVERLDSNGAVLGYFTGWQYQQNEVELRSGDRLVLFSDGLVDVCSVHGEEFGEAGLVELAVDGVHLSAAELRRQILEAVTKHCDGRFQDDTTLIVLAVE